MGKLENRYPSDEIRMCKRKKRFLTRQSAVLEHIRKHREDLCSRFLRTYQCTYCTYWHLTKDDPRNSLSFKEQQELREGYKAVDFEEMERLVEGYEKAAKKERRKARNKKSS